MKIELITLIAILAGTVIGFISSHCIKDIIRAELSKPIWIYVTHQQDGNLLTGKAPIVLSISKANREELLHTVLIQYPEILEVMKDHASYNDAIKQLLDDIND